MVTPIEAEGNEYYQGRYKEGMIKGPSHERGGVNMLAVEGDFIYPRKYAKQGAALRAEILRIENKMKRLENKLSKSANPQLAENTYKRTFDKVKGELEQLYQTEQALKDQIVAEKEAKEAAELEMQQPEMQEQMQMPEEQMYAKGGVVDTTPRMRADQWNKQFWNEYLANPSNFPNITNPSDYYYGFDGRKTPLTEQEFYDAQFLKYQDDWEPRTTRPIRQFPGNVFVPQQPQPVKNVYRPISPAQQVFIDIASQVGRNAGIANNIFTPTKNIEGLINKAESVTTPATTTAPTAAATTPASNVITDKNLSAAGYIPNTVASERMPSRGISRVANPNIKAPTPAQKVEFSKTYQPPMANEDATKLPGFQVGDIGVALNSLIPAAYNLYQSMQPTAEYNFGRVRPIDYIPLSPEQALRDQRIAASTMANMTTRMPAGMRSGMLANLQAGALKGMQDTRFGYDQQNMQNLNQVNQANAQIQAQNIQLGMQERQLQDAATAARQQLGATGFSQLGNAFGGVGSAMNQRQQGMDLAQISNTVNKYFDIQMGADGKPQLVMKKKSTVG
jgi:hypothetical protein